MCGAYVLGAANDFGMLGGRPLLLGICLAVRGLLVVATGVALVLLRRARWPRQQDRAVLLGLGGTLVAVVVTHLTRIPVGQVQGPLIASGGLLCVLYFAQRGPIVPRAVLGSAVAISGVALVLIVGKRPSGLEPAARLTSILALVALNVVGILSARSSEEQRRSRFEAERGERHARQALAGNLRELAAAKERAEAMLHARAAFLAAMSHEFRTPMNAVIGLSDLLADAPLPSEYGAHVRTIRDSSRALLAMLEDILDFAKIDAQKLTLSPAPFELRALAVSVTDMLRPAARDRSLDLSVEVGADVPEHVIGDDARLRQVLVNLVSNAIKFTERGSVRLQLAAGPASGGDAEVTFRVVDTGIGMTPEVVERVFRPFEQADAGDTRRVGGTGLGLAISQRIVVAMGGHIHVESEPDRGSVFSFTLRLPVTEAPAEVAAAVRAGERPSLAILVVDDVPVNRYVARAKLVRLGHEVDVAFDGPGAIEAVAERDYDVVLMDVQMPGMSGIEATRRIGEVTAHKRAPHVVAMTASVFEEDREKCRRAGMRDFVGKPIDVAQLEGVLHRVAEERGVTAGPILARASLRRLQRIESRGEPGFVEDVFRLFLADAPKRLLRMEEALARGDAQGIEGEAHVLKTSSATVGATGMSELCTEIEAAARESQVDLARPKIVALAVQLGEVERALLREIESATRPAAR